MSQASAPRRSITLRQWQHEALHAFLNHRSANFLAVACPGAGKTTFALTAARHWLRGERLPLVVVAPTRHLKTQWAQAAERFGFHLEPAWDASTGDIPPDMHGIVVTYAQVASAARTLFNVSRGGIVILDEVAQLIRRPALAALVDELYSTARKHRTSVWTVTQQYASYTGSPLAGERMFRGDSISSRASSWAS